MDIETFTTLFTKIASLTVAGLAFGLGFWTAKRIIFCKP
jgi:hypothetical protein